MGGEDAVGLSSECASGLFWEHLKLRTLIRICTGSDTQIRTAFRHERGMHSDRVPSHSDRDSTVHCLARPTAASTHLTASQPTSTRTHEQTQGRVVRACAPGPSRPSRAANLVREAMRAGPITSAWTRQSCRQRRGRPPGDGACRVPRSILSAVRHTHVARVFVVGCLRLDHRPISEPPASPGWFDVHMRLRVEGSVVRTEDIKPLWPRGIKESLPTCT